MVHVRSDALARAEPAMLGLVRSPLENLVLTVKGAPGVRKCFLLVLSNWFAVDSCPPY